MRVEELRALLDAPVEVPELWTLGFPWAPRYAVRWRVAGKDFMGPVSDGVVTGWESEPTAKQIAAELEMFYSAVRVDLAKAEAGGEYALCAPLYPPVGCTVRIPRPEGFGG